MKIQDLERVCTIKQTLDEIREVKKCMEECVDNGNMQLGYTEHGSENSIAIGSMLTAFISQRIINEVNKIEEGLKDEIEKL